MKEFFKKYWIPISLAVIVIGYFLYKRSKDNFVAMGVDEILVGKFPAKIELSNPRYQLSTVDVKMSYKLQQFVQNTYHYDGQAANDFNEKKGDIRFASIDDPASQSTTFFIIDEKGSSSAKAITQENAVAYRTIYWNTNQISELVVNPQLA